MKNSDLTRFERFQLWLLRLHPVKQGLLSGGLFLIIATIIYAILWIPQLNNFENTMFFIFIFFFSILMPAITFAVIFPASLKLVIDRLTRILGFFPTPEEQVAIRSWYVRGVKPKSQRLDEALPKYLAYIEPFAKGRYLYPNKWLNITMFIIFLLNALFVVFKVLIIHDFSFFDVYFLIFSLIFVVATVPIKFKNGNPVLRFLNRKARLRYDERRRELDESRF